MAISIDWNTRIIFIPKADLTPIQLVPTEIYNMDLNWFRIQLKAAETSIYGITYPDTHIHNTEATLSGLVYARMIILINNFTVTFEDGQYAVNLVGANSNVADKVNVNQVSVRSQNSAGMTSSPAVEHSSFDNKVTFDANSPYSGTVFPTGTGQKPVNNLVDALQIAVYRGFNRIYLLSNLTISAGINVSDYTFESDNWLHEITVEEGADTENTNFEKVSLNGSLSGIWNVLTNCWAYTLTNFCGWMVGGSFVDITLAPFNEDSDGQSFFDNVVPMYPDSTSTINMNVNTSIACTNLSGDYTINNLTNGSSVEIGMSSGKVHLTNSCLAGHVHLSGIGLLTNNAHINVDINTDGLMSKELIALSVEEEIGKEIRYASYNGGVTLDTVNGTNSYAYPYGTPSYPCKTTTNSAMIRAATGLTKIYLLSDLTLTGMPDGILSNLTIHSNKGFRTNTVTVDNVLITNCIAENLNLTGTVKSGSSAKITNCNVYDLFNATLNAERCTILGGVYKDTELSKCTLRGLIKIEENGTFSGIDLIFEGDNTVIDLQNKVCTVSLDINSGIVTFINAVASCLIELNLRGGEIVLDASCIGGDFYAEGYGTLFNESTMNIKDNHLLALETIPEPIMSYTRP